VKKDKSSSTLKVGVMVLLILLVDALTKWWVQADLPLIAKSPPWYPYGGVGVFKDLFGVEFALVHETNKGAAWGAFADFQPYLMVVRIVLIALLLGYLLFFNRQKALLFPLTLIVAGAIGNVLDFFIYGHVIDMFQFILWGYHFPVFNVADMSIFFGVCWILLKTLFFETKASPELRH
jgi:signal peptidase II